MLTAALIIWNLDMSGITHLEIEELANIHFHKMIFSWICSLSGIFHAVK